MSLSDAIRTRRKELGLTLKELADRIGVTEATVQRYESGNIKNIRNERIIKVAEALEIEPTMLMGWEDATQQFYHRGQPFSLEELKDAVAQGIERSKFNRKTYNMNQEFVKVMEELSSNSHMTEQEKFLNAAEHVIDAHKNDTEILLITLPNGDSIPIDIPLTGMLSKHSLANIIVETLTSHNVFDSYISDKKEK